MIRVHPELVPGVIDALSERDLAGIREQHAQAPQFWQKLVDAIARRRGQA